MLAELRRGYRDTETRSVTAKPSDEQQSSMKRSNGTARDGPPVKAIGTRAGL